MNNDVMKSICYRIYQSFVVAPLIIYFLTGSIELGLKYGLVESVIKTVCYYIFEKFWKMKQRCDKNE